MDTYRVRSRKYPASEYSDRVLNLNKLEDRNLENQIKYIEKEKDTVLLMINRDIKKLEVDVEERTEHVRQTINQERLKYYNSMLHSKLHSKMVNNNDFSNRLRKIGLIKKDKIDKENTIVAEEKNIQDNVQLNRLKKNLSANAKLNIYSKEAINQEHEASLYINNDRPRSSTDYFDPFTVNIEPITANNLTPNKRSKSSIFETKKLAESTLSSSVSSLNKASIGIKGVVIKKEKIIKRDQTQSSTETNITTGGTVSPSPLSSKSPSPVPVIQNQITPDNTLVQTDQQAITDIDSSSPGIKDDLSKSNQIEDNKLDVSVTITEIKIPNKKARQRHHSYHKDSSNKSSCTKKENKQITKQASLTNLRKISTK